MESSDSVAVAKKESVLFGATTSRVRTVNHKILASIGFAWTDAYFRRANFERRCLAGIQSQYGNLYWFAERKWVRQSDFLDTKPRSLILPHRFLSRLDGILGTLGHLGEISFGVADLGIDLPCTCGKLLRGSSLSSRCGCKIRSFEVA